MVDITFRALRHRIEIDFSDLEKKEFTKTIDLDRRYSRRGEVWHIVGFDLVEGGATGRSPIQQFWSEGRRLWAEGRFVVVKRKDHPFCADDLPPNSLLVDAQIQGSSTDIRTRQFHHQPLDGSVVPEVAEYIARYQLYRGRLPLQRGYYEIDTPRLLVVADQDNPKALEIQKQLESYGNPDNPNLIVDVGGDGNKLQAIRKHWHLRVPFFGINAGHRGYLQNDITPQDLILNRESLVVHHMPLLHVDIHCTDGSRKQVYGFNEVWVERQTGQSAWLEVIWNNENRISKVVGDGLIISTAAGSTGYARNICGFSLPTYVKELLLVGMAVTEPAEWRNAIFPQDAVFEIRVLDHAKRPVRAYVDGLAQGSIEAIRIKSSNIASVELAFISGYDIAAKHAKIQLPYFQKQPPSDGTI